MDYIEDCPMMNQANIMQEPLSLVNTDLNSSSSSKYFSVPSEDQTSSLNLTVPDNGIEIMEECQDSQGHQHTEAEVKGDHEQNIPETTSNENYYYEPLVCLNTSANENSNAICEVKDEAALSDQPEERDVVERDNPDTYCSEIESEDYSEESGSEESDTSEWEVLQENSKSSQEPTENPPIPIKRIQKRIKVPPKILRNDSCEIYVRCSQNIGGKRCWSKIQYCIFCSIKGKPRNGFKGLTKHLFKFHKREAQVTKILKIPKGDQQRKLLLEKIRNIGNYEHNVKVLRENKGEIIPWRCPPSPVSYKKFLPCKWCKAFFQRRDLWKHMRACPFNENVDQPAKDCTKEAAMLLPTSYEASTKLNINVFEKMRSDEITATAENDALIRIYAEKLYSKYKDDPQCHIHISQKLREMSRLLIEISKRNDAVDTLGKCLTPDHYPLVCEATRVVAGYDVTSGKYKTPSLAVKIGHALKKCCFIKQGMAVESNNEEMEREAQNFQNLMNETWATEVADKAATTSKRSKRVSNMSEADYMMQLEQVVKDEIINLENSQAEQPVKDETGTPEVNSFLYERLMAMEDSKEDSYEFDDEEDDEDDDGELSEFSEGREGARNECSEYEYSGIESDDYSNETDSESDSDSDKKAKTKTRSRKSNSKSGSRKISQKSSNSSRPPLQNVPDGIYVRCSQNIGGKRRWGKVQYCIFCSNKGRSKCGFTGLSKHLFKFHSKEPDVAKILKYPVGDPERKVLLEQIRNLGNYEHNMKVLRENKGEIIPWRCPPNPVSYKKFVPCKWCKGFFQKSLLGKHLRACPFNTNSDQPYRGCAKEAAMLLPNSCVASPQLIENVFMKMQADDITATVRNDTLITLYAEKLYITHSTDDQCHIMISQKLRDVGRLLMEIRKRNFAVDNLTKCLAPEYYPLVCDVTRSIAGFNDVTGKYKSPSLAIKIGHTLTKCCSIKQGVAAESNDEMMEKEVQNFQAAMNCSWTTEVSRNALRTLKEAKWDTPTIVPLPEDLLRLQQYLYSEMTSISRKLCESATKELWKYLCKLCLTSIVLLNRRRSGEISKMTLSAYLNKGLSTATPQIVSALTPVEREMSKTFIKVDVIGRDGKIAPFIFTPFILAKTDVLVNTRDFVGINKENKYLFAQTFEGAKTNIRGHDCLREFSKKCGARQPHALTGANLKNFISASPY